MLLANYKKRNNLIVGIIMTILTLIVLYPFFIMLFVSLKGAKEALIDPNSFPRTFVWSNYSKSWKLMGFPGPFFNSIMVTTIAVLIDITLPSMCAFILGKSKKKISLFLYYFFIAGIMIPFYTALIPIVKIMTTLHLNNSRIGLALGLAGRSTPMVLFFYYGFVKGISNSIIESAVVDGAKTWLIYRKIIFPLLKPITTTIIILNSLGYWNSFLFPSLMLTSVKIRTIPLCQYFFYGEYGTQWQLAFAAYLIAMVPVLILYIFGQKNIIKGISAGAVKG